jgi:hypothetical protein
MHHSTTFYLMMCHIAESFSHLSCIAFKPGTNTACGIQDMTVIQEPRIGPNRRPGLTLAPPISIKCVPLRVPKSVYSSKMTIHTKPMFERWLNTILQEKLDRPFVNLLFGASQTGKSTLLNEIFAQGYTANQPGRSDACGSRGRYRGNGLRHGTPMRQPRIQTTKTTADTL